MKENVKPGEDKIPAWPGRGIEDWPEAQGLRIRIAEFVCSTNRQIVLGNIPMKMRSTNCVDTYQ